MKMRKGVVVLIGLTLSFLVGCGNSEQPKLDEKVLSPESVEIYDVSVDKIWEERNNGRELLRGFPFISNQPIIDFKGKFSDQFYSRIDYRYKYAPLKDVDFWKLRTNPYLKDFIYVLPTWANHFKRVSNDLFEDIGYSYNLSSKEQEILKWWIGTGGILWIEGGIYSTRYDTFKRNGEIDLKGINRKIIYKSSNLTFFDRKVKTAIYKSKRVDNINYEPLKLEFKVKSDLDYFKDIKTLKIVTDNFLTADFLAEGKYLLTTDNNKPVVSFVRYGQGGVVFFRPFDFKDKKYDGELLRWKLLFYLLNKSYLDEEKERYQEVADKFDTDKILILHSLNFDYNSYKLKGDSYQFLQPIAQYLKLHPNIKIEISGHTDNIGSKKYNQKLSLNRANSVKFALVGMGIDKDRMVIKGYGEEKPMATNKTEKGRALNRRVEFRILSE